MRFSAIRVVVAVSFAFAATACSSRPAPSNNEYSPRIDPADFSTVIDNPFFPLVPGTRMIYEGDTADGRQRTVTEVTRDTRKLMGVNTVVVHDTVTLDGKPHEETFDWYAQDREGNVWYFGEDTKKVEGSTVDTSGSFEAGVHGALPGIIMKAHPTVGERYRQEFAKGIAEDTGEILSTTGTADVPFGGSYRDLLVTKDVNPLDSGAAIENKYFAHGVGFILVIHVTGPAERVELVGVERF
jgi:hypothetical protein